MIPLLLASSLWIASQNPPQPSGEVFQAPPVSVPIEKISDALATDLALIGLGTGADLISTDWAINRGCVEGNPLVPRPEGRIALKSGGASIRGVLAYWLRRKGHRSIANVFRWAGFGTDLLITGNNVKCGASR